MKKKSVALAVFSIVLVGLWMNSGTLVQAEKQTVTTNGKVSTSDHSSQGSSEYESTVISTSEEASHVELITETEDEKLPEEGQETEFAIPSQDESLPESNEWTMEVINQEERKTRNWDLTSNGIGGYGNMGRYSIRDFFSGSQIKIGRVTPTAIKLTLSRSNTLNDGWAIAIFFQSAKLGVSSEYLNWRVKYGSTVAKEMTVSQGDRVLIASGESAAAKKVTVTIEPQFDIYAYYQRDVTKPSAGVLAGKTGVSFDIWCTTGTSKSNAESNSGKNKSLTSEFIKAVETQ